MLNKRLNCGEIQPSSCKTILKNIGVPFVIALNDFKYTWIFAKLRVISATSIILSSKFVQVKKTAKSSWRLFLWQRKQMILGGQKHFRSKIKEVRRNIHVSFVRLKMNVSYLHHIINQTWRTGRFQLEYPSSLRCSVTKIPAVSLAWLRWLCGYNCHTINKVSPVKFLVKTSQQWLLFHRCLPLQKAAMLLLWKDPSSAWSGRRGAWTEINKLMVKLCLCNTLSNITCLCCSARRIKR